MTRRLMRRGAGSLGVLLLAAVSLLAFAPTAFAVETDQYDPFTACPTDNPALNDPAAEFAICAAGSGEGQLRIGDETLQLGRIGVQFGSIGLGQSDPNCPEVGVCFGQVPGTTTVEDDPSLIWTKLPRHAHPHWGSWKWKGKKGKSKSKAKPKVLPMKITVESAGDISAFSPGFLFEKPLPLYRLPIKLHVEAPWFDDDCYVGSNRNPIVMVPFVVAPPANVEFLTDPNGFPLEQFTLTGVPLQDAQLAIPGARGCGHGWKSDARANALVNELLGLPSAAGLNELLLPDTDLALVGAGFDETAPNGGAALEAAFEAAK